MLTIEVELLAGRYAATRHNDRKLPEWPPHPARFFSALVAALHDNEPVDPQEREALLWLEALPPPSLDVDIDANDRVGQRDVLDVYVPVNDVSLVGDVERPLRSARAAVAALEELPSDPETKRELKKAKAAVEKAETKLKELIADQQRPDENPPASALKMAAALLPERRTRQMRTFPVAFPARPSFVFAWSEAVPPKFLRPLDSLCDRVTRLGHSSSLVRCAIVDRIVTPTLVPDVNGDRVLRTVGVGQLVRLETEFARHRGVEGRVLPAIPQRYGPPDSKHDEAEPERSYFSNTDWIVFERTGGSRPLSSRATDLTRALRNSLLEQHGARTLPDSLSGHRQDGSPAGDPHLAFVALPFVGHTHADASVQGCAIVMPSALAATERETLFRLVAAWERERGGRDGTVEIGDGTLPGVRFRRVELSSKASLRSATWCRPARRFVTATPIALDKNPGNLRSNQGGTAAKACLEAQRFVADACERIGLPRPTSIEVSLAPLLTGTQPVRAFRPWPDRPGRSPRVRIHADIRFGQLVHGPVLLGAGRFFGLGLCMPVADEESR